MNENPASRERASSPRLLLLALLLSNAACLFVSQEGRPPVNTWSETNGPVIPHDTFPADCSLCHLGGDWNTLREDFHYDHEAETGVALEGAHAQAQCLRCHNDRGPVAAFAARGCAGCHQDVHEGRLGPNCADCHGQIEWRPRDQIAKHATTRFPLIASHAGVACIRCHPGSEVGNFQRASIDCESCHQDDLQRATDPDHIAMGWVDSCERCHVPTRWESARTDHSFFPLIGRHRAAACTECHIGGVFQGTPRDCAACHIDEYNRTTDPNHLTAGFSTSCELCHTPNGWDGARFDHTTWPLTGAHSSASCNACHAGGVYQGTPRDCAACHIDEYNQTSDPNHRSAGFPTNCEACHSTSRWGGASFNHNFPLTGPHRLGCSTCHTNPNNFQVFDCTNCHEHRQSRMDEKHREVSGYVYNSQACFNCHPRGRH